jgi:hypothetical protein
MASAFDLVIPQGSTFSQSLRWEGPAFIYKAISAVPQLAPVRLTAVAHGIPDGWRVAIMSVLGMMQLNAKNDPPARSDFVQATLIDVNTVELNTINAAGFAPYTSGGFIRFATPIDLTGFAAALTIKDKVGGIVLFTLTTTAGIVLDNAKKTITYTFTPAQIAAFTFTRGVFTLELTSSGGVATELLQGSVTVDPR